MYKSDGLTIQLRYCVNRPTNPMIRLLDVDEKYITCMLIIKIIIIMFNCMPISLECAMAARKHG